MTGKGAKGWAIERGSEQDSGPVGTRWGAKARTLASDLSGATEADRHPAILDDDRDLTHSLGNREHALEGR